MPNQIQNPFLNLCEQLSNNIADMIEHPDCPKPLRSKLMDVTYDLMNSSEADVGLRRAEIEARYLLPLYLRKYSGESFT